MKDSEKIYKQISVITESGKEIFVIVCANDGGIDEEMKIKSLKKKVF
jgi:hypothetical protein